MQDGAPISEDELIAQAVGGHEVAIHQLLMLYYDRVAAFIEKKIPPDLRGVLAPEDMCQEACFAAVAELNSFQPHGEKSFRNWLLTIAERKLIDEIRALRTAKRGGGKRVIQQPQAGDASTIIPLLEQVAVHERTPSRSVADHELVSAVQVALAGLKEEYRTAIRHRYIEGLPAAQTAERMGRSEGAVRMLCSRGLHRLAEVLGNASKFFGPEA